MDLNDIEKVALPSTAAMISTHDSNGTCKEEWRVCNCQFASLIRGLRNEDQNAKLPPKPDLEDKSVSFEIRADIERKRRVYLNNAGINEVRHSLSDLTNEEIFDKIHMLDQATRDEAFLRIRKKKSELKDLIEEIGAKLQGVTFCENRLFSLLSEAEKLAQMRKDQQFKVAPVKIATAKAAGQKAVKDVKKSVANDTGLDVAAMLAGFNANLALQKIKEKTSEERKEKEEENVKEILSIIDGPKEEKKEEKIVEVINDSSFDLSLIPD